MPKAKRSRSRHHTIRKCWQAAMVVVGVFVVLSAFIAVSTQRPLISRALAQADTQFSHDPGLHFGHESGPAPEPLFDDSVRPGDIPDGVAINALMHTLRVSTDPDAAALGRLQARVAGMNLGESDLEILVRELGDFDTQARDQEARIEAVRPSSVGTVSAASARLLEDRYVEEQKNLSALVEDHYQQLLESLSPEGAAILQEHLLHVKSRIRIYPPPDMSKRTL